jgi:hypothetical protein
MPVQFSLAFNFRTYLTPIKSPENSSHKKTDSPRPSAAAEEYSEADIAPPIGYAITVDGISPKDFKRAPPRIRIGISGELSDVQVEIYKCKAEAEH